MSPVPILVQKFGGTSVSTPEARQHVAAHVRRARDDGYQVAIVVSAMGRRGDPYATDTLLDLLRRDADVVDPRDYNLMFICGEAISVPIVAQTLRRAGIPATGLTSAQAGIFTDGNPLEAEIARIDTSRLRSLLERGEVPVITGGQGVAPGTLDFNTLGRGGSDTSGVAVGVALGAAKVEIFTDVEVISATDPRLVPEAARIRQIGYASMHAMARWGAKVVHPRAIMAGMRGGTPIVLRSTFSQDPGTVIANVADAGGVVGIAALSSMETVALPAGSADASRRAQWEQRSVIMSADDRASGDLVVGAGSEKVGELDAAVAELGATVRRLGPCCWASVIGEGAALREQVPRSRAELDRSGIALLAFEAAEGRSTFVVPEAARGAAVRALYAVAFGETTSTG